MIHKRSIFACESNYGSENKDKPVGICGHKAMHLILCHVKMSTIDTWPTGHSMFLVPGLVKFVFIIEKYT